jgi:hypothetical protein
MADAGPASAARGTFVGIGRGDSRDTRLLAGPVLHALQPTIAPGSPP